MISILILKGLMAGYITDEEKRKKMNTIIIIIVSFTLILLITLTSIPQIMINVLFDNDNPDFLNDMEKIIVYQNAIILIEELNQEWIEEMEEKYSYCDEVVVINNYKLTWHYLISVDSVLLNQDFRKMDNNKIIENGLKFLDRDVTVEDKEVKETDENNNVKIVKKKVAIIKIETKNFEEALPELNIVTEESTLMATNVFFTITSISSIEGNLNIYDDNVNFEDLQEYPEGSANLPYYNQTDAKWGYKNYGNSTIQDGGCGPTSLAMVISGLTGEKITPDIMADWSYKNGHRAEGQGSYWSLMTAGGSHYGLKVQAVSRKDPKTIVKALSEGYPVIVSMGKGHFTNGGHFIVLRGITDDGKILIHDSASVSRSQKEWDLNIIMGESSTNGGIAGSPFWIFKP